MKRREFIGLVGGAVAAWPLGARAQPRKTPRLAILLFNSPQIDSIGPLLEGLQGLGYVDGKSIAFEYRYAEGKVERLPDLASELVQLKPDVIFAYGGDVVPHAKRATTSIPIVAMVSNDPVQSGLVASISRPGGNVTGITLIYDDLAGKMLELLKEVVPEISRVAVCGTRIMRIPSTARHNVWRLTAACNCSRFRCAGPMISIKHSSPRSTVGPRALSWYRRVCS
jgi:putative tryptophan/tyrosine transport system substrate-binding protein